MNSSAAIDRSQAVVCSLDKSDSENLTASFCDEISCFLWANGFRNGRCLSSRCGSHLLSPGVYSFSQEDDIVAKKHFTSKDNIPNLSNKKT